MWIVTIIAKQERKQSIITQFGFNLLNKYCEGVMSYFRNRFIIVTWSVGCDKVKRHSSE